MCAGRSPRVTLVTLVVSFAVAGAATAIWSAEPKVLAQFKIPAHGAPIYMPVNVGGMDYNFVLDTGATINFVDVSLKEHLGPFVRDIAVGTAGDDLKLAVYGGLKKSSLGPIDIPEGDAVVAFDFSPIQRWIGAPIHGVLGMSFLKQHVIRIDFDRGELVFLSSETRPADDWGEKIPITFQRGNPYVSAQVLLGVDSPFLLDTGDASECGIATSAFNELARFGRLELIRQDFAVTASGKREVLVGRLKRLNVGQFAHRDVIVSRGQTSQIGNRYLSRYTVTLDFPRGAMYLRPGEKFAEPSRTDRSGLRLARVGGATIVDSVFANSSADRQGVKAGDRLLQVDGHDVECEDMFTIYRKYFYGEPSTKVTVSIQRGDDRHQFQLELDDLRSDVPDAKSLK